jgi:signal transduction histidine kinase
VIATERVFTSVARRYERDAAAANISIRTHVDPSADQIIADPDRLEQAIGNLVANALRHTPPEGTIDLDGRAGANGYTLRVSDTGTGIAPEHLAHVFDRFYKVDASRTSGAGGSGLGLSIVKAIVERHGGSISVTSSGGRTEFVIVLPLTPHAVSSISGACGSRSIFRRRRLITVSTVRSVT